MSEVLDHCLARICKRKVDAVTGEILRGETVGTGFLAVYPWLVTCNHVVAECVKGKKATEAIDVGEVTGLLVDFPVHPELNGVLFKGILHASKPKIDKPGLEDIEDVAILKLELLDTTFALDADDWASKLKYERATTAYVDQTIITKGFHLDKSDELRGTTRTRGTDGRISVELSEQESIKGASGSPVWSEDAQSIIGMLASQRGENAGTFTYKRAYMIPLYKILDACEDLKTAVLAAKERQFDFCLMPNPLFQAEMMEEVVDIFSASSLLLAGFLKKHRLPTDTDANTLGEKLRGEAVQGMGKIIRNLTVVVRDTLRGLERAADFKAAKNLINDAERIINALSLLAIRQSQAEQLHAGVLYSSSLNLSIAQRSLGSAEIVSAQRMQCLPQYTLSKSRPEVQGKHAIASFDLMETGIKADAAVNYIGKQFWTKVFRGYATDTFSLPRLRDQIRAELSADDREKKNYYLVVSLCTDDQRGSLWGSNEVRIKLAQEIPELPVIVLNDAPETSVYVTSDGELMAEIYNFYDVVNSYDNRNQSGNPAETAR